MFWDFIQETFRSFLSLMSTFRIVDFLDICLVAFILYNGIKLVRETRAVQLVKGLLFLIVLKLVVQWLDMQAVGYLLTLLFESAVVIVVVLFQPEIRHALETVGKSSISNIGLFNGKNANILKLRDDWKNAIARICRAASDMSDKKIGALIVFEKDIMLGEIIKTGTAIDAQVTAELVGNIFYPKAPLHDGAMIVRDGKVCAAGCILPLTQNNAISSELGTRHRAALGISEQSDCMVAVISEETGYISIALKGVLYRNISDGELRERLTNYLLGDIKDGDDNILGRVKKWAKKD
ncbi:MAG: diadenylate cyclase CdaA [Clostridiales bacterium]|nr:diadenylate cyclase CdaA [Clostridiales bacterium]